MPYIPHTEQEVKEMLEAIGSPSMEDLFDSVPERIRLGRALDLPEPLTELELAVHLQKLAGLNRSDLACFLGGGTYNHYQPPAISHLISRSEFFTAYTPYQPEISQGTLQAIFEFQTMVCELLGMDVANASMYDGAEAAAEAVLMAQRIKAKDGKGQVALLRTVNPLYRDAIKTYLAHSGREIVEVGFAGDGRVDEDQLGEACRGALTVVAQSPNYFGVIEDLEAVNRACKQAGAVMIAVVTEPVSMGLLEPPGSFGADIVVGEGQGLGLPMGFGGPHLGLFASRGEHVRKMPGRLVGQTVDADGRRGYALTLATREQHIRRAKATSNICTNQGLMALAATIYMSLMGAEGLAGLAAENRARAEYLKEKIAPLASLPFAAPTFNEFVVDLGVDPGPALDAMLEKKILAGIPLKKRYPELPNAVLVTVTEMLDRDALDAYAAELSAALGRTRS